MSGDNTGESERRVRQDIEHRVAGSSVCELGYSACVLDTDPQCNATETFGVTHEQMIKEGRFTLADIYLSKRSALDCVLGFGDRFESRLSVVPGHRMITTVEPRLDSEIQARIATEEQSLLDVDDMKREHRLRLKGALDSLRSHYDVVLVDTPPDLGFLMTTALIASDWLVIPVFPSGYDLKGLETLMGTVGKVRSRYNSRLRLAGVLVGNFDKRAKLDSDIYAMLEGTFGPGVVFDTRITRSVRHREATVYGRTIFEHARDSNSATEYLALAEEMSQRHGWDVNRMQEEVLRSQGSEG